MKVLVVGMGIAGLTAAIVASDEGDDVTVLSKELNPLVSNSAWAQGGVVYKGLNDSPSVLFKDIARASDGMFKRDSLQEFCNEAPDFLKDFLIDRIGVPFATTDDGKLGEKKDTVEQSLKLTKEAAHTHRRIVFCDDNTGEIIVKHLLNYIKEHTKIKIRSGQMVVDLITIPHHATNPLSVYENVQAVGAYVLNIKTGKVSSNFSEKIILATGGIGQIYQHSTNPKSATGDGIALAARAGVRIVNMEFTQFHPTSLAVKSEDAFLLSETLRGEGAVIVNEQGEDFLAKIHPRGSLAPRDVVSRAIWHEQIATGEPHVYLNLEKLRMSDISKRFPKIFKFCKKNNIDLNKVKKIPVTPAFHFSCGGILADMDGRTSLTSLFAVGECACSGVHGANRLASTSLLEGLYFGQRAAKAEVLPYGNIAQHGRKKTKWTTRDVSPWQAAIRPKKASKVRMVQFSSALKLLMWNYVGIIRSTENLELAIEELHSMKARIDAMYRKAILTKELLELRNAVSVALVVAMSAIKNPISKGCHYRVQ